MQHVSYKERTHGLQYTSSDETLFLAAVIPLVKSFWDDVSTETKDLAIKVAG